MARPLTPRPARQARALLVTTVLVVVLHALAWVALSLLLRPPSILKDVAPPFYTRTIAPEAPPAAVAVTPTAPAAKPNRPSARITTAKAAPKNKAKTSATESPQVAQAPTPSASAEEPAASEAPAWAETPHATEPPVPPTQLASASAPAQPSASAPASTPEARPGTAVAAASAAASASGTDTAFLRQWPGDTRLKYQLGGNYRGELRGDARVLWQREGTRYHTSVQLDLGLLLSMSLTSQGEITPTGLQPGAYEEQVGKRRRGVRLGEDVRLDNGERVSRPNAVQDAASQFVELSHRFATGQLKAVPGTQINFWLARPGGVDEWTYDVVGEETLQLPSLGAVQAVHLKPRPLAKPRGPISAEIWYAPTLQFLPVRIRLTQGPDTYIDLLVDSIEQR